jgi:hypothetical protein
MELDKDIQVLAARLSAHRWLRRDDPQVRRALTDDLFYAGLTQRLAACGFELAENPYASHVSLRIRRELEQSVFGREDSWLSGNLGLNRNQIALLVVLWALLILPKRQRQLERQVDGVDRGQAEMFAQEKPLPTAAELNISVLEATLLADFGDRLGGRTVIRQFSLPVLSRQGFIERRDGRIYEGPLLDLALDYNRMARRVLDGALADLFGSSLDRVLESEVADAGHDAPAPEAAADDV